MRILLSNIPFARLLLWAAMFAAFPAGSIAGETVRLGVPESAFQGLDPADAKLSLRHIFSMTSFGSYTIDVESFAESDSFRNAVRTNKIDIFPISAIDYLALEDFVRPVTGAVQHGDSPLSRLVLLVRKDSGLNSVDDLSGKKVIFHEGPNYDVAKLWVSKLIRESANANTESFFRDTSKSARNSEVILPVFFGKADACVATKESWQAMADLNPQLGVQLISLAESEAIVGNLIAFHRDFDLDGKDVFVSEMLRFHETESGRQILTVSKAKRMVPFQPEWLDGVREMLENPGRAFAGEGQDENLRGGTE